MSESNEQFIESFNTMQREAHGINIKNGWWYKRSKIISLCHESRIDYRPHLIIELIGLAHTELSEGVEAVRKQPPETWDDYNTKDTLVRELAGTIVRIMDIAEFFDLQLAKAIEFEINEARTRGYMHGGKVA